MNLKPPPRRREYTKLGNFLKDARRRLRDKRTGEIPSVEEMAGQLTVTRGFVYQVEQGRRKPKDSTLGQWASVYGVRPVDLYKCLGQIPMDLVASFKEEPASDLVDPFFD